MPLPCVVKGLWLAAQPTEGILVSAKACIEGLLGLIVRKWVKGDQRPLFHSCCTLWTQCRRPTHPSVCSGCYIPAWTCSFWLVNLRYDILSGVSICVCMCVCGCLSCQKRVCPWSLGTTPSTRCAVGCISWHGQSLPSLQAQILLHQHQHQQQFTANVAKHFI